MNKTINHWFFFIMSVGGGHNNTLFFRRNLVFVKDSEFRIIIDLHYNLWDWGLINYILSSYNLGVAKRQGEETNFFF